jgi:hypothetical protein
MTIGSQRFPHVPYNFNGLIPNDTYTQRFPGSVTTPLVLDETIPVPNTQDTDDVQRAWHDYLLASHSLLDGLGAPMTCNEWSFNPVIGFDLNLPSSDRSSTVQVDLRFSDALLATANTLPRLFILAKYSSNITFDYSPEGQLERVKLDNLI